MDCPSCGAAMIEQVLGATPDGAGAPYRSVGSRSPVDARQHLLHRCPGCSGLWIDTSCQLHGLDRGDDDQPGAPGQIGCPECSAALDVLPSLHQPEITYRICFGCGGAWFEGATLETAARAAPDAFADPVTAALALLLKELG